jgi:ribonuclease Y
LHGFSIFFTAIKSIIHIKRHKLGKTMWYIIITGLSIGFIIGAVAFLLMYAYKIRQQADRILSQAKYKWERIKKEIESDRKEAHLKLKDELYKKRIEFDMEMKRERSELERFQSKLNTRYDSLEQKEDRLDSLKRDLERKERNLSRLGDKVRLDEEKVKDIHQDLVSKLESVGSMTQEKARQVLLDSLEDEVRLSNQKWLQKIEDEARQFGKEKAISILVTTMQRYTADQVSPHTSGIVQLPNDDMKGRIIGKEGRNIKALEMATGMEFVIGDTPEVITISGFNPIRREVARRTLEKLISDGRINPTRIEETVTQCEKELDDIIQEYGKNAILQFNLQGVKQEIISLLGKLHFRTSFSQNVLMHSIEVAMFARIIAEELGLEKPEIAMRGGLLHDIGKAVSAEVEGPHALIGADIAKRCGEHPYVVNAIAAHHEEVPFTSIYSPIVMIADTISASRPGARRETLSAYVKRLEKLEEICNTFEGVKKAYALQAGREVRIVIQETLLDDDKAALLARDIARKVEKEMTFPGQIKVNVIREKRAIEYAR